MTFAYFSFTYYHACEIIVTCHKLIENKVNFNFVSLMNFEKKKNAVYVRVRTHLVGCVGVRVHTCTRGCGCSLCRPAYLILESISGSVSQCPLDMYYVCVCISRLMWEMSSQ